MRYGPAAGVIHISSGRDADRSFVQVEDAGPGVAAEERDHIFELFYRGTESRRVDGCGIGLSIVRSVARLHRAEIRLDSSPLGGLSVRVSFPARVDPGEPALPS
jgi:signal transduction histidine kinase